MHASMMYPRQAGQVSLLANRFDHDGKWVGSAQKEADGRSIFLKIYWLTYGRCGFSRKRVWRKVLSRFLPRQLRLKPHLQPDTIPMGIIHNIGHQTFAKGVGNNIPCHSPAIFFTAQCMIVKGTLPERPLFTEVAVNRKRAYPLDPSDSFGQRATLPKRKQTVKMIRHNYPSQPLPPAIILDLTQNFDQ